MADHHAFCLKTGVDLPQQYRIDGTTVADACLAIQIHDWGRRSTSRYACPRSLAAMLTGAELQKRAGVLSLFTFLTHYRWTLTSLLIIKRRWVCGEVAGMKAEQYSLAEIKGNYQQNAKTGYAQKNQLRELNTSGRLAWRQDKFAQYHRTINAGCSIIGVLNLACSPVLPPDIPITVMNL